MQFRFENIFRFLLRAPSKLLKLDQISIDKLSISTANRLRRNQIRGAIEQMRVFLAGTTFFAPALSLQAWNAGVNAMVIAWTLTMWVFSWGLFFRWHYSYQTKGSESDMADFVSETRVNAGLYCLGMILFYPHVSGDGKTIICSIMVGSLALGTVGFSHAPRAAFWYLGLHTATITLVPLFYGLYWNSTPDLLLAALAFVAGLAICNAALERARSQMKAFADHESLVQKTEIVDLLLKDYEEQGVEWVWRTDQHGRIITCPQPILELLTHEKETGEGVALLASLGAHIDAQGAGDLDKVSVAFDECLEFHDVSLPLYSASTQTLRWIIMRGRPQFEENKFVGFRGIFADATSRVESQKQVEFLAEKDPLTGAFNRNYIQTCLENMDPLVDKFTAYLIDLDGFKHVNDSYGHTVGDALLQQAMERLHNVVGEIGVVARLGGDEFLILIDESKKYSIRDPDGLCARMLTQLSTPFLIGEYDILVSASIGTTNFPNDTTHGPGLLIQADLALYAAKKSGRNRCEPFVHSMQEALQKRLVVTNRLRQALRHGQIIPYYQPQYSAKTMKLVGFEALARWTDTELGVVGPDIFIPIAEETGLIHEIGESMLMAACADALTWTAPAGEPLPTVSVNISPVQVMRGNLVKSVETALAKTGLPPERLEIEVTESVLIADIKGTGQILKRLCELGVSIALDDFGTGYSSLSYLRALPLHRLKIDQSFVSDIDNPEAQSVVQAIIDLSRSLKLEVVAEGVETTQHLNTLRDMQCSVLQGYHFSRPVPASQVEGLTLDFSKSAA